LALLLCAATCWQAQAQTAAAPAAPAASPAGVVKRITGAVSLQRAGQLLSAPPGTVVMVGDTLRTGADGSAGITLADDTLMTTGPNSELVISGFAFDPTTQDGKLLASLWRGTLHMVTGLVGKKAPEQVKVQTRTVVLGVRGTEFIVDASGAEQ
jgi:hypothetical protein